MNALHAQKKPPIRAAFSVLRDYASVFMTRSIVSGLCSAR